MRDRLVDTLLHDLRFAIRTLRRTPAFTATALLCLALGIGANTAIFSVINAVLLRPLPFRDPARLVYVWESRPAKGVERNVVSPANFLDWRAQSTAFTDLAAFYDARVNLTGAGEPEEVPAQGTSASFFGILGVQPALGRAYTPQEDAPGVDRVVVLSHELWQRRYGGDVGILGQRITLDGNPATVVGVMPKGFAIEGSRAQLWRPLRLDPAVDYREELGRFMKVIGRLRPGITAARAQSEMGLIATRLVQAHPDFNTGWGVNIVPMEEQVVGGVRRALLVLGGVVAFVLLIACANVANLMLARAAARRREMALRAALGAARGRLLRQLLTESVVVALAGGALGLALAYWGTRALTALAPAGLPRVREIGIDGRSLVFTLVVALLTGVAFGFVPALQAARQDLQDALKEGSRGATRSSRARSTLVVAQVALSLVLLIGAGLMVRSFARLQAVSPGFDPARVLTARVQLPASKYRESARSTAFFTDLVQRTAATPGVQAVGMINWLPFGGLGSATGFWIEGRPQPKPGEDWVADVRSVDAGYFRAMRIPLRAGRVFGPGESAEARKAVVVNEAFVRAHWASRSPIGQHVLMPWGDTLRGEIVGVVGDTRHVGLDSLPRPMLYWAMAQFPSNAMTIVVRTAGEPMRAAPALVRAVRALDPDQPVADVKPLEDYLGQSVAQRRFSMTLLSAFAALALVLAAAGLYGVLAYSVAQRNRELGVRVALGATSRDVLALVVGEGLRLAVVGVAAGVVTALVLTRVIASLLYGVSATDPLTFAVLAGALTLVALGASYLPARRAMRVNPMEALRAD